MIRSPPTKAGFGGELSSAALVCVFVSAVCNEMTFLRESE